jgi:hypothetical protein
MATRWHTPQLEAQLSAPKQKKYDEKACLPDFCRFFYLACLPYFSVFYFKHPTKSSPLPTMTKMCQKWVYYGFVS